MPSSPWSTSGGSGNATATTTPIAPQSNVDQINSANYLVNADKIKLRADWDAEQQIKGQLDANAAALGVSSTAYDNAVAAVSTGLIAAGAPANWATTWPDGATSGPWTSIMDNLRTWWTSVSLQRAALQKAIADKIQANAAYADALARSGYNLFKNGNCEDPNATGYEANGISTNISYTGSKSTRVMFTTPGGWSRTPKTALLPASPGEQFYASAMVFNDAGNQAAIMAYFYNAALAQVGAQDTQVVSAAGTWTKTETQQSAPMTAPAGTVYVQFECRSYRADGVSGAGASYFDCLYACRKVGAGVLEADAIQTTDYAYNGGNILGTRIQIGVAGQPGILTSAAGLQIGTTVFSSYMQTRIVQALDGTTSGGRVMYRGNIDTTSRGGAPNIACLSVTRRRWDTTLKTCRLELVIQPSVSGSSDNLDAMREAQVDLYRQSAAGTSGTMTLIDSWFQPLKDRSYGNFGTDTDALNNTKITFSAVDAGISSGFPAALITLHNAYGPSAGNCFYSAAGNADGSALTNNGTTWPAGLSGGTSGGGGGGGGSGGGGCPAPWVEITLRSGLVVAAGDLWDGAVVAGVNDITGEPAVGVVRCPQRIWKDRAAVILEDGRTPEFSLDHRLLTEDAGWIPVKALKVGQVILGSSAGKVVGIAPPVLSEVVTFQVDGCHTYISDGILSHNIKRMVP